MCRGVEGSARRLQYRGVAQIVILYPCAYVDCNQLDSGDLCNDYATNKLRTLRMTFNIRTRRGSYKSDHDIKAWHGLQDKVCGFNQIINCCIKCPYN